MALVEIGKQYNATWSVHISISISILLFFLSLSFRFFLFLSFSLRLSLTLLLISFLFLSPAEIDGSGSMVRWSGGPGLSRWFWSFPSTLFLSLFLFPTSFSRLCVSCLFLSPSFLFFYFLFFFCQLHVDFPEHYPMEAPQVNNQPQFLISACSSNGCVRFLLVDVWMEGDAQAIVSTLQSNGDCPDKYRSFINYWHMQEVASPVHLLEDIDQLC